MVLFYTYHESKAATVLVEQKQVSLEDSTSFFIHKLDQALRLKNLDSLDAIFLSFVKNKLENNDLAQGHSLLNQIIADKTLSDTLKILAFKNKAILFGQIDYTKKRHAFESALKIIRETGILSDLIPIYNIEIAKTYLSQLNFLGATSTLKKINISSIQNLEKKVENLGICGVLYSQMRDTSQALSALNEAISIARQNNDYFGIGTINSTLGGIYSAQLKQRQTAIDYYRISMNAFH